jgi:hypothetical protein
VSQLSVPHPTLFVVGRAGGVFRVQKIVSDTDVRQLWKLTITASRVCFIAVALQTANRDK